MTDTTPAAVTNVLLHYDGDAEWTYAEISDNDGDDSDYLFAVAVPDQLATALAEADEAFRLARSAIFEHVGWDPEGGHFTEPCAEWIGDEPRPPLAHWSVVYPAGAGDTANALHLATAPTAEEAQALIDDMPPLWHSWRWSIERGDRPAVLTRSRFVVEGPIWIGGYESKCHRCGNHRSDHPTCTRFTFGDPIHPDARGVLALRLEGDLPRVEHPGCDQLADVSVGLDAYYCPACSWSGRISGAWVAEKVARLTGVTPQELVQGLDDEPDHGA